MDEHRQPMVGDPRAALAAALKVLREATGRTIRDMAAATGVPRTTLGNFMTGHARPNRAQLELILDDMRATSAERAQILRIWEEAHSSHLRIVTVARDISLDARMAELERQAALAVRLLRRVHARLDAVIGVDAGR